MQSMGGLDHRFKARAVSAAGVVFNVIEGGQGAPVVLLHGWPLSWYSWRKVMAPLADAGFRVIAPDLPGLGDSSNSPRGYEKREIAEQLRALTQALGCERISLVGHDMGAPIAYAWARTYGSEVERLAILDVPLNGFGLAEFAQRLGLWHFKFFAMPELPEILIEGRELALIKSFYPTYLPEAMTESDITEYARTYCRNKATHASLAYYRSMGADEQWMRSVAVQEKLRMPVLTLSGEFAGSYAPFESAAQLASDVRGEIIGSCGHYLAEEKPEQTVAALKRFLAY
jgi:pimeloyl-ACP methyl ester carboxylesterase